mmetsp:Transcript_23469/g.55435  ORF Transcript_23469/g.55435 Transcript_23469/m.55435 type:complete len:203 (+) Transcript_23469:268-876(+)
MLPPTAFLRGASRSTSGAASGSRLSIGIRCAAAPSPSAKSRPECRSSSSGASSESLSLNRESSSRKSASFAALRSTSLSSSLSSLRDSSLVWSSSSSSEFLSSPHSDFPSRETFGFRPSHDPLFSDSGDASNSSSNSSLTTFCFFDASFTDLLLGSSKFGSPPRAIESEASGDAFLFHFATSGNVAGTSCPPFPPFRFAVAT